MDLAASNMAILFFFFWNKADSIVNWENPAKYNALSLSENSYWAVFKRVWKL